MPNTQPYSHFQSNQLTLLKPDIVPGQEKPCMFLAPEYEY